MTCILPPTIHLDREWIMHFIYPIDEIVTELNRDIEDYYFTLGQPSPSIPKEQLQNIIYAAVEDAVNARLVWCNARESLDQAIANTFSEYSGDDNDELSCQLYMHALEEQITSIRVWVSMVMPKHTWGVWFVRRMTDAVILERGRDYRIIEYERLVASGDIEVNKKISKVLKIG